MQGLEANDECDREKESSQSRSKRDMETQAKDKVSALQANNNSMIQINPTTQREAK